MPTQAIVNQARHNLRAALDRRPRRVYTQDVIGAAPVSLVVRHMYERQLYQTIPRHPRMRGVPEDVAALL